MATSIRKSAAKRGVDIPSPPSEAEIENYIDDIDCLVVGPHHCLNTRQYRQYVGK
jgi:PTS system cellobiose-specific IIB component